MSTTHNPDYLDAEEAPGDVLPSAAALFQQSVLYAGKTALVLGLGESGLAMALWLLACGAQVRVADTRSETDVTLRLAHLRAVVPTLSFISGAFDAALLDGIDFVALSPGLAPQRELPLIAHAAAERDIAVWGEIELFAQALAALRAQCDYAPKLIAITGTNGKTTVTRLTALLCRRAGLRTALAGNISPAALDVLRLMLAEGVALDGLPQVWVLELSSFQLYSTFSLQADVATVLNITQDHLDWHGDLAAYVAAKQRIFGSHTVRVLNRDDAAVMALASAASARSLASPTFGSAPPSTLDSFGLVSENGMQWLAVAVALDADERPRRQAKHLPVIAPALEVKRLMPVDALKIRGLHNAVNGLAALALCRAIGLPLAPLLHGLRDYTGEPHRVELVATLAEVEYYDDSKGTNVGATVAAINGLGYGGRPNRLWLIAGGEGKGQDFTPLTEPLSKYARAVLLIGRDADLMRTALQASGVEIIDSASLPAAVQQAAALAQPGDAVLLSPACASYDMFRSYVHRAEVFVDAVREVALARGEVLL